MGDLLALINDVLRRVVMIAWGVFLLTWSIGWALRGSPIPIVRVKRSGQHMIEDAVWAAFWLTMGSTIFWLVSMLAKTISATVGSPVNTTLTATVTP